MTSPSSNLTLDAYAHPFVPIPSKSQSTPLKNNTTVPSVIQPIANNPIYNEVYPQLTPAMNIHQYPLQHSFSQPPSSLIKNAILTQIESRVKTSIMKTFGASAAVHQPNNNYSNVGGNNNNSNGWITTTNINHRYRNNKSNKRFRRKFDGRKYNHGYQYRSTCNNNKRQRIQRNSDYINTSGGFNTKKNTAEIDILFKDLAVGSSQTSINDSTIKNYIKNTFSCTDEFIAAANASATVEPVFDPFLAQVTPNNPVNTILCLNLSDFNNTSAVGNSSMNAHMSEAIAGYFMPTNIPPVSNLNTSNVLNDSSTVLPYTPLTSQFNFPILCPTSVPSLPPTLNNNPYINSVNVCTTENKLLTNGITLADLVRILPTVLPFPLTPSELGITSVVNNNASNIPVNVSAIPQLSAIRTNNASFDSTQNSGRSQSAVSSTANHKSLVNMLASVREETVGEVNKLSPMRSGNKYKRQRKITAVKFGSFDDIFANNKQQKLSQPLSNITDIFVNKMSVGKKSFVPSFVNKTKEIKVYKPAFLKGAKERNLAITNAMVVNNTYEDMNASLRLKKLTATSNLLKIALKGDKELKKSKQMVEGKMEVKQRKGGGCFKSCSKMKGKKLEAIQALRILTNVDLQENVNPVTIIPTGVSVVGDSCSPTLIPFSVYNVDKENIGLNDNGSGSGGGKECHNLQYFQHQKYMNMNMGMGNRMKKRRHYNRW